MMSEPGRGCPGNPVRAGCVQRALALLIDFSCIICGSVFVLILISAGIETGSPGDPVVAVRFLLFGGVLFFATLSVLPLLYFTLFHSINGQTPGKAVMGIRVVSRGQERLTAGRSFLRFVGLLLSAFPLGAGFIWALFDRNRRAWHDLLAATEVIVR